MNAQISKITIEQLQRDSSIREKVFSTKDEFKENFAEVVNFFIATAILSNRSINTVKSYYTNLKLFFNYLDKQFPNINTLDQLKPIHISRFYIYSQTNLNNSPRTIQKKKNVLSQFFNFIIEQGFIAHEQNPIPSRETLGILDKNIIREAIFLEDDEEKLFFNAIRKNRYSFVKTRDKIIFGLFIYTGLRLSELLNFDIKDIEDLRTNYSHSIRGKGLKLRKISINPQAFTEGYLSDLDEYLRLRKNYAINSDDPDSDEALFLSQEGHRLSSRQVQRCAKKYSEHAAINKNVTPHKFRHSFATKLINNGININIVKELLGHASISTTQIYTHVTATDLTQAVNSVPV